MPHQFLRKKTVGILYSALNLQILILITDVVLVWSFNVKNRTKPRCLRTFLCKLWEIDTIMNTNYNTLLKCEAWRSERLKAGLLAFFWQVTQRWTRLLFSLSALYFVSIGCRFIGHWIDWIIFQSGSIVSYSMRKQIHLLFVKIWQQYEEN